MDSSLYKHIMDYLLEIINRNAGIPNYKLPSERMLAASFDTSRKPVRNAYESLIERGYVTNIHGRGYFIRSDIKPDNLLAAFHKELKISFVIPSILSRFSHAILSGVGDFCTENNIEYSIHVSDNSSEKESALLRSVPHSGSMGTILFPADNDKFCHDELVRYTVRKYPFVLVDRSLPNIRASFVASDDHKAMVDAVSFLHREGYRNPLFISPPSTEASSVESRINGYTHGLLKSYQTMSPRNLLNLNDSHLRPEYFIAKHLRQYPDTDVIIAPGTQLKLLTAAMQELDLHIQLMLFDDELSNKEREKLKPYFIQQDGYHIGYEAAQILYGHILGDMRPVTRRLPVTITDFEGNPVFQQSSPT